TTACYFFSAFKFLQVVSFKKDIVWKEITSLIREGFHFAMSKISAIGNMEADKTMLGHFKTHTDVGVYSMSSRLINMALIPMTTVYSVTMPKFFSLGEKGLDRAFDFYLRILSFLLPYGLVVSLSIFLFSDFIIYVLGDDYYEVSNCLEALIFFPVLKIITTGLSDVLTGSGYQKEKSYLQMMALIVNVILNCIFIPTFSWLGAVISLYVSESILFLSYFFVYKRNLSRETLSS
ncbi:oligosaccharide flippase family protein, partial [Vibrio parahaemolyticus]|nr:oligosaccharide flippase family protein [Vibrio parahaemolyticus]